ncbi:uncharacterized protein MONBRDRAFT_36263 [Monosiga brevicollis MX1]|uniref:Methyltransferase type 12 domain-containing protein n=1 Tax=Monosiga brevicollis TaxID=81824 RepID=A9UU62_MONBE|nr:uncharacterized protein MONBRDRAFT_36263 [Monosiga brevicollis MX1]EDQ91612.1 predicted protein [Monosiga brevicollis MX1]|eukprot:XP_001744034.1 hypothetical protein [Monosiga brevicollis MX1]
MANSDMDMTKLGNGPRARRTSRGLERSRAHLRQHRSRTGSEEEKQNINTLSWVKFSLLLAFDVTMIGINTCIWTLASVFLFCFSKCHDWLLMKLVGVNYLYNVSWEDPRVDRTALKLHEGDHVLTIASAGDNVLDFIIDGAKVTAVDLNACQLALCSLKRAAILELNHDEFFRIFAKQDMDLLRNKYHLLKKHMDANAIKFWDSKLPSFSGFMYSGSSGWLAFFLFRVLFPVTGFSWIRAALVEGVSQDDFRRRVKNHEARLEWLAWIADSVLMPIFAPLAGVPEAQLNLGMSREGNVHTIMERVFLNTDLVEDNYFFYGYIVGEYSERCCPRYLKAEHFSTLKRAMAGGKLILYHGTLADRLRLDAQVAKPPSYTAAIMLDHLDWMDDMMVNEELSLLWPLLNNDTGRVLWRSFSDEPHRAALKHLSAEKVDNGSGDRTGMYWGVWVAGKNTCGNHPELTSPGLFWQEQQPMSLVDKVVTGAKIVTFPVLSPVLSMASNAAARLTGVSKEDLTNNAHAKKIEAFYASQADAYDAFRENFLHARVHLATCLPLPPGELTWVDVGAGTARNLEFFPVDTLKRRFKKIYILDISASLLDVARRRVEAAGLSDVVELVLADFTDLSDKGKSALPAPGSVDLVTFSYSLSMIPDKRSALQQATRLLAPGGSLGIADFFYRNDSDTYKDKPVSKWISHVYDLGCKLWFRQDGVHLLSNDVLDTLNDSTELTCAERFRGSVPLLPILNPWHGIHITRKLSAKDREVFTDSAASSVASIVEEEEEENSLDAESKPKPMNGHATGKGKGKGKKNKSK